MAKNTLKTHKSKKFWIILLMSLGGLALILGSALGIACSKLGKNALSLEAKTNATTATDFVEQTTLSDVSTTDYVYFPSYDDVKNNGTYGFISDDQRICEPTDWALANYASLNTSYTGLLHKRSNGSCSWWCRSGYSSSVWTVFSAGNVRSLLIFSDPTSGDRASRCALHLNLKSVISALGAGNATRGTTTTSGNSDESKEFHTITLDNLMYPQTIVTDTTITSELDKLGDSAKTGRKYPGRASISANDGTCVTDSLIPEYKFGNEYYVKVPGYAYNSSYTYSDGTTTVGQNGENSIWIKVEPITWVIPTSEWETYGTKLTNKDTGATGSMEVFSLYGLVSGMYWQTHGNTKWETSFWRNYLNGSYYTSTTTDGTANFSGVGFIDTIYHDVPTKVAKPTLSTSSFTYTGSAINLISKGAISGYNSSTMNISGYSQTSVGNYSVTFSLKDTSNYVWSGGGTDSFSLSWSISKATNSWNVTPSMANWIYGNTASTPVGTPKFGTVTRTYKVSTATNSPYTSTVPTNAGTYTMRSVVTGTTNYTGLTNTVNFTISPKTLSTPTNLAVSTTGAVTWTAVSNASSYQYKIGSGSYASITSGTNLFSTLVASATAKTVYVRAVGSGNYATGSDASVSVSFCTVTISAGTGGSVDSSSRIVISGSAVSTSANTVSFAGLQSVTATASTGYTFSRWTNASGSVTANGTITANFTANELTFSNATITTTFSTSAQTGTINTASNGTGSYSYSITSGNTSSYFSISGTTITIKASTPANSYSLTVRATDNKSAKTKDASITITINKASISPSVSMSSYTYAGTKSTPIISGNTGGGTVTYYYNTSNSTSGGTLWTKVTSATSLNAGTYYMYATIIETTNYLGATTSAVEFTISKANITLTLSMTGYTYGGTKSTPSISGNTGNGAVTYYYNTTNTNLNGIAWSSVGDSLTLNAGTYYMYATIIETTNYLGATTSAVEFTISKANITLTLSMTGYTYGGTKSSPSISGNTGGGTVTYYYNTLNSTTGGTAWTNVTSSTSLSAGTYYMYAVVGETTNYNGATSKAVAFTISRAKISLPTVKADLTFNTKTQSPTITYDQTYSQITSSSTLSATHAGTYTITIEIKDKTNYEFTDGTQSKSFQWTIKRFTITDDNTTITTGE